MLLIEDLSKSYPIEEPSLWQHIFKTQRQRPRRRVLHSIGLHISDPLALGLVGENGAGKSTLLKILAGILTPDSGFARVHQIIPYQNRMEHAKNLGYLAGHRSNLFPEISALENYTYLSKIYRLEFASFKKRVNALMERLHFIQFANQPVRTLSLGNRMKANLIGTLLHRPRLIILDEPTIGLDWKTKHEVRSLLKEEQQESASLLIISSHDFEDINEICEQAVVIENGGLTHLTQLESVRKSGWINTLKKSQVEDENGG